MFVHSDILFGETDSEGSQAVPPYHPRYLFTLRKLDKVNPSIVACHPVKKKNQNNAPLLSPLTFANVSPR